MERSGRRIEWWMTKITEGKTKIVWDLPGTGDVMVHSKDDITAGDGARRDVMPGKAKLATLTTANTFKLLKRAGIPTHFINQGSEQTFRAKKLDMIPLELVARRVAYGSFIDRYPVIVPQTRFNFLQFEMFSKDDRNHDPAISYDFHKGIVSRYDARKPQSPNTLIDSMPISDSPFAVSAEQLQIMKQLTNDTFEVLEAAWADQGVALIDLKIECGLTIDGQVSVGDVIDNDAWRIWQHGDPDKMLDKQLYRDGHPLEYVAEKYAFVAEATNHFNV